MTIVVRSLALLSASLVFAACAVSPTDANAYARAGVLALDRQNATNLTIARANPALDQSALAAAAQQIAAGAAESDAQLAAVAARLQAQEDTLRDVLRTLGAFVVEQIPAGSTVRELAAIIGRRLGEAQTSAEPAPMDEAAMRAEILAAANELGFGPEQIAALERAAGGDDALTDILAPAAGGSGLLLALVALLRIIYGRSRGQGEIDELWERLAKAEQSPSVTTAAVR